MPLPENKTFVEQTTDYLRTRILDREWGDSLPPERELAATLQVARNTLRKAIGILREEGLLQVPEGKRRHLIIRPEPAENPARSKTPALVVFLTHLPLEELPPHSLLRADLIRRALTRTGVDFRVLTSRAFRMDRPAVALRELHEAHPGCLWILHHTTEPIQRWFQSEGLPCVLFGTPYPGIDLPSFVVNLTASMRHAMGHLRRMGHSNLVLVEPERPLAGHLRVRSVMKEQAGPWEQVRSLVWGGDAMAFLASVKRMMTSARPPTAFILMDAPHTVALYSSLCHIGMRIPADASVIALFDDPFLACIAPKLAHYHENAEVEAKRMVTLVRQALRGSTPVRSSTFLQEFVPGGTVAPPPEN